MSDTHDHPEVTDIHDVACKQCGYDLTGLRPDALCPECGYEIQRSLADDQLIHASPQYLAALSRGLAIILVTLILTVVADIAMLVATILYVTRTVAQGQAAVQSSMTTVSTISYGADALGAVALAYGWWLFSVPDPAFTGHLGGSKSRSVVRYATLIVAAVTIAVIPVNIVVTQGAYSQQLSIGASVVLILLGLLILAAWATSFFAAMLYVRWLAPRIPDWDTFRTAKRYMWLLPVIYVFGSFCFGLGPLVALIMYWLMLYNIRNRISAIRAAQPSLAA